MLDGRLTPDDVRKALAGMGFSVRALSPLGPAKHIFTHKVWQMEGWLAETDASPALPENCVWALPEELAADYSVPSAFAAYLPAMEGQSRT